MDEDEKKELTQGRNLKSELILLESTERKGTITPQQTNTKTLCMELN